MKNNKITLLVEERSMAIVLEEDHILMYDLEPSTKEIRLETEGILKEVNAELYKKISSYFGVDLKEFGVEKYDEALELEN